MAVPLAALSACASTSAGSDKVYVIATDTTFAPFEFQDSNSNYVGIDVDLLDAIAKDQGFKYELQPLGFNAAVAALESKQADGVIAGMSITDARKEKYDFSQAYYDSGVVMAIKADNGTVTGYDSLAGQKVAVKTGTEGATFAESIAAQYGFELKYFDESPMMYEDVKTGNTIACFEDYPVIGYGISQGNGLKMVTDMEKGSSYGFAVLKGNVPELLEMFDKGLANVRSNGTYDSIIGKYIAKE
ncbi:MAG: transporter substrate-binding domain-containing protein [Clostridiales bacterium]|nr:transporter substrate-binding domain-containing protein [Clostridiales bacterium]